MTVRDLGTRLITRVISISTGINGVRLTHYISQASMQTYHIVAGCQHYLNRFTWRHDSILNFIANSLQPAINDRFLLYANVNGFSNPSIITVDNYRPDRLFLIQSKCLIMYSNI